VDEPFMTKVTGRVVELMQGAYPDLVDAGEHVERVTLAEEERFGHTLRVGLKMVETLVADQRAKGETRIPGDEIFRLYDTYGFPVDLLRDIAGDAGLTLDETGFDGAMEEQRARARESWAGSGEAAVPAHLKELTTRVWVEALWYDTMEAEAGVVAIFAGDGREPVAELREGQAGQVLLDRTPFYPEAGGQVGDMGVFTADGLVADVTGTQRPAPGVVLHDLRVRRGTLRMAATVRAAVDAARRRMTMKNHTATHLLHAALRQTLGDHVKQAGSLVAPDRLRFDFTHFSPLGPHEVDRLEEAVNAQIWENRPVTTEVMRLDAAIASGAMALFGEKYGEQVRVVRVPEFSTELCGGTHVRATGEIGLFKIVAQGGVAAGIRRIEAVTGPGAYQQVKREEQVLAEAAARVKARPLELVEKVEKLTEAARDLEREVQRLQGRLLGRTLEALLERVTDVEGVRVVGALVEAADVKGMRELGDRLRERLESGVIALAMQADGKVAWVTMVTKDLVGRLHAGNLARELAKLTGGGGGGRPDVAEAGGKEPARIPDALGKLPELVSGQLKR
jgi:alanyl-tRNA synthetase